MKITLGSPSLEVSGAVTDVSVVRQEDMETRLGVDLGWCTGPEAHRVQRSERLLTAFLGVGRVLLLPAAAPSAQRHGGWRSLEAASLQISQLIVGILRGGAPAVVGASCW